ncbi:UNVERIFIED_CONTAM: CMP-sialic acid transporter 3 [Sesamum angustifolium]|uniref:CMP-sialic acid transporter 3 n=1 Tax=Sesamum angustifolium TaxID=2727405 RepID=A0AAW2LW41_9LAMI
MPVSVARSAVGFCSDSAQPENSWVDEERDDRVQCLSFQAGVSIPKSISRAYDRHRSKVSSKQRALNVLLVGGDCVLVGLQPILVFMSKVDGRFKFSPISVNFLTEVAKVIFAIVMLIFQARRQKVGEKPLLSISTFIQAARNNVLLAVPALLYAINNYLKFIMQLYFNPATVKMLSNLKVLVIAVLLKVIMRRRFSVIQWEALALLLIGITINQLKSFPEGSSALGLPVTTELIFVRLWSYIQLLGILGSAIFKGPGSFDILEGHSKATMLLICNNAAQGILSSFFFKYADTILKKYSSTVATIFTGIASAVMFGHTLTINFMLGISVVFISMHQFFSPLAKAKDDQQNGVLERMNVQDSHRSRDSSFINMAAGANEEVESVYLLKVQCTYAISSKVLDSSFLHFAMSRLVTASDLMKDNLFFPPKVTSALGGSNARNLKVDLLSECEMDKVLRSKNSRKTIGCLHEQ